MGWAAKKDAREVEANTTAEGCQYRQRSRRDRILLAMRVVSKTDPDGRSVSSPP